MPKPVELSYKSGLILGILENLRLFHTFTVVEVSALKRVGSVKWLLSTVSSRFNEYKRNSLL